MNKLVSNQEKAIHRLRCDTVDMIELIKNQFVRARQCVVEKRLEEIEVIYSTEHRINAFELMIDKECENILALYAPVATDLRFVISVLKMVTDLERIGDHAESIGRLMEEFHEGVSSEMLEAFGIPEMFSKAIEMLDDVSQAFEKGDTALARRVFPRDAFLNAKNREAHVVATRLARRNVDDLPYIITCVSFVRKLERVGDQVKNIAESIIFHHEAEVMRHRNKTRRP